MPCFTCHVGIHRGTEVQHDATLAGNGSAAAPLEVAVPLRLAGAVSTLLDGVITVTNTAAGGPAIVATGANFARGTASGLDRGQCGRSARGSTLLRARLLVGGLLVVGGLVGAGGFVRAVFGHVALQIFELGEHGLSVGRLLLDVGCGHDVAGFSRQRCRHWLRANHIAPVAHSDTAGAAAWVADSDEVGLAALAPPHAAALYGLTLHGTGMEDADHNTTRFVVLAREPLTDFAGIEGPLMTTFMFEVKNIPAALYKALGGFATNGVNMTKLESYQTGDSFAATQFYCDIVGAPGDERIDRALEELDFQTKSLRLLGTYAQARERR